MVKKINTAQRVSDGDLSDNFVFARSLLAYREAAKRVCGRVLEIGTGAGYGIREIAPRVVSFSTVDKHRPPLQTVDNQANVDFHQAKVPPLDFPSGSFDFVISFQVIEHIRDDFAFLAEVNRVLKHGGSFIVTTPNAKMSLTRNPWHVREYSAGEFTNLTECNFDRVEALGVFGNQRVAEYFEQNRRSVERLARFDFLDLQHRLPGWMLRLPYDVLNRLNRRQLLAANEALTTSFSPEDYHLGPVADNAFDLFYICQKN